MLNEISTNRILKHFQDNSCLAIISSYRTERTEQENRKLLNKLKQKVRSLKFGFSELISRWSEIDPETKEVISSDERSLMIYGINLEDAIKFGSKAASIACSRHGAQKSVPTLNEVLNFND